MTKHPMITAENFSELYASLETLEVNKIATTLLKIPQLRDEIKKKLNTQPRKVREKLYYNIVGRNVLAMFAQHRPKRL